jgi:hypothetical protein
MEAKMTRVKTDKTDSYFIAEYGGRFLMESFINQTRCRKEIEVN